MPLPSPRLQKRPDRDWSINDSGLAVVPYRNGSGLKLDASLRENSLLVSMLHLAHLRHRIGKLDQSGMRIASSQDHVHHLRLLTKNFSNCLWVEHLVTDRVVNLVEHDEVPLARQDRLRSRLPRLFDHPDVFGIGLRAANLYEATPHLLHDEVLAHHL